MKTYIVLFRGINVGGKNLLPMKDLRSLLEDDGCENVTTYIQSGNVVLNAELGVLKRIPSKIEEVFGFKPEMLVLDTDDFEAAIDANPFDAHDGKTVHFYFCSQTPKINKDRMELSAAADEVYSLEGNVFYLYAPSGIGRSKLVANIESCLGVAATGRNLNTVLKIKSIVGNI